MRPPPGLARWLLERALPSDVREDVSGDLEEVFQQRVHSNQRARLWYWLEVVRFGWRFGAERVRERFSDARHAGAVIGAGLGIEVKLGLRMLRKYPGLTLVSVLAVAVTVGIGAAWFEFAHYFASPKLPLPEGERIVGVQSWDVLNSRKEMRVLHDFAAWRREVKTIEHLGAGFVTARNLITEDGASAPVDVAEMTASVFRVTRVQPLMGRTLVDPDEAEGAAPVAVIGYKTWQARFGGDLHIIGKTMRLTGTTYTIVGVMPEGYAFPIWQTVWVPLRGRLDRYAALQGPAVTVVGRLAPGVTMAEAQAELATIGQRTSALFPDTHKNVRLRVRPYVKTLVSDEVRIVAFSTNGLFILLVVVACANVATLIFARTALRQSEIVVRNALGASRFRIVVQLFVEAFVLAALGAGIAVVGATYGMRRGMDLFWTVQGSPDMRPFWWTDNLSLGTLLYVAGLTFLCALIAGAIPALKVTEKLQIRLRAATTGGGTVRFGGVWTGIIIAQVALTVACMTAAANLTYDLLTERTGAAPLASGDYLVAQLALDREQALERNTRAEQVAFDARFRRLQEALRETLLREPGVTGVTLANALPGMVHPDQQIEIEGVPIRDGGHVVREALVDADYFDVLRVPVLRGRTFLSTAASAGANSVIVNQKLVQEMLGGRDAIGRRLRYVRDDGPGEWLTIVGVVRAVGTNTYLGTEDPGVYRLARPGDTGRVFIGVRTASPERFAPRLRALTVAVSPALRLHKVEPLSETARTERWSSQALLIVFALVVLMALLLSTAGIYAIMSCAVTQRAREIGIRWALGASRAGILRSIFSRAFAQLGAGVLLGALGTISLASLTGGRPDSAGKLIAMLLVPALVMLIGLLACVIPARRGLRIQPTDALKGA